MATLSIPLLQANVQQIECLLTLAEELHFGRTAARLGISQSRASQLIAALEVRVGAQLVERTSRRVALTPAGERFLAELAPAYRSFASAFSNASERAASGALAALRIGFTGMVYEQMTELLRLLDDRHGVTVQIHDLPLGSPFTAVLDGVIDGVIAELPVRDPELTVGFAFPAQDQLLALGSGHPLAAAAAVDRERLAEVDLLHPEGDAPEYWKAARTPLTTPAGKPICSSTGITTVQQGMTLTATGRYAMLACRPLAEHNRRTDIRFVPVRGLEAASQTGLVWRTGNTNPSLAALADLARAELGSPDPAAPAPAGH